MREIKFRVWDDDNKDMEYWGLQGRNYYACSGEERYHIMQYTGLRDKNDARIYEGDIIKSPFEAEYSVGVVEMNQGHWSIGQPSTGLFDVEELYEDDWIKCTVLGNIYENPDLMEE